MIFNSIDFALFLPIVFMLYWLVNSRSLKLQNLLIVVASYIFYGLGVELSLACNARVCSDNSKTKLALPEVKLGLLSGGGGIQRLPRLVGLQALLDIMLTI